MAEIKIIRKLKCNYINTVLYSRLKLLFVNSVSNFLRILFHFQIIAKLFANY